LWALISDQPFVMAYLVVQGISVIEPRKPVFTPALCRDLLARASQYEQIDHATESLRQDVLRKQRKLAAFNSNQYSRRRP